MAAATVAAEYFIIMGNEDAVYDKMLLDLIYRGPASVSILKILSRAEARL